jgi:hypothetical protein
MRRMLGWVLCVTTLLASSGCLCRWKTDCYGDLIDDISDHNFEVDCMYCPAFDLTRIGFPDWCACPMNRALDCQRCADNLPYYGPRNRTMAQSLAAARSQSQQEASPAQEETLPPQPSEPDKIDLPPAPAAEAGLLKIPSLQ